MKESSLIELKPLFSSPVDGRPRCSAAASPSPTTNPFQTPDFGQDDDSPFEDTYEPAPATPTARP